MWLIFACTSLLLTEKLLVQIDPGLYYFINQGCLTVDNMDDKEEMQIVEVPFLRIILPHDRHSLVRPPLFLVVPDYEGLHTRSGSTDLLIIVLSLNTKVLVVDKKSLTMSLWLGLFADICPTLYTFISHINKLATE